MGPCGAVPFPPEQKPQHGANWKPSERRVFDVLTLKRNPLHKQFVLVTS